MSYKPLFSQPKQETPIKKTTKYQPLFSGVEEKTEITKPSLPSVKMPTVYTPFDGTLTKTPESQKVSYGELSRIRNIPKSVGGGQYKVDQYNKPVLTERAYGSLPTKTGQERDHIIPVSLGGTSYDPNLQYLESKKTLLDKILNKPAQAKNRQEGKMLVEWSAINDYKSGKIDLNQARARVLNWNNQPPNIIKETIKNLPVSIAETIFPALKVYGQIPKEEPFAKLSKPQQALAVAKELPGATKEVAQQVVKFMAGLPIEFGLDFVNGALQLANKNKIEEIDIPVLGKYSPYSLEAEKLLKENQEMAKQMGISNEKTQQVVGLFKTLLVDNVLRAVATSGTYAKIGTTVGKIKTYEPYLKGSVEAEYLFQKQPKIEELLLGKQKKAEFNIKDKNGNVGLVKLEQKGKNVNIEILKPRNLKAKPVEIGQTGLPAIPETITPVTTTQVIPPVITPKIKPETAITEVLEPQVGKVATTEVKDPKTALIQEEQVKTETTALQDAINEFKNIKQGFIIDKPTEKIISDKDQEFLKPKAILTKFQTKSDRNIISESGEYTNAFWLLKPEFIPEKLKTRMTPLLDGQKPETKEIWNNAKEGSPKPVSDIVGYVEKPESYILKTAKGENIHVNKFYYDYLKKNIPDFSLKATEPKKPIIIYSGNKEAGLLMPMIIDEKNAIFFKDKKPSLPKIEVKKPAIPEIKKVSEVKEFKSKEVKEAIDELKELSKDQSGFISTKPINKIGEYFKTTKEPTNYEKLKDIWFGKKDIKSLKADVETRKLQKLIKDTLGRKKYDLTAKNYDKAIQVYIDTKRNPADVEKYYNKLTDDQKEIVDLSQKLPPEIKQIADYISESYDIVGSEALEADVIKNVLENYVARVWDIKQGQSTEMFRKFGIKTKHAKQRTLSTILEGWSKGMTLKVEGATNNLNILKKEINNTIADKQFIKELQKLKTVDGDPLLTIKQLDGYKEVKHPNFTVWGYSGVAKGDAIGRNFIITKDDVVLERKRLYAPKEIADNMNNILGTSALIDTPGIKTITKYNAILKSWILQTSLFHHFAFARSYYLGTGGKTFNELNIRNAYRNGIKMIENMDGVVQLGVKNGLTLGVKQDWNEQLLKEKTFIGSVLDNLKATKIVKDKILELRERQADFLFGEFGAGLKVKAFEIELRNLTKKYPNKDINDLAKMSANLINDDFGGLHLQRIGRNPTVQHIFRIFALAPDWTESNIMSMVKAVGAGNKQERKMYRKFWAGIFTKGALLTVMTNLLIASVDEDDEDTKNTWDRFVRNYQTAWEQGRLMWTGVDITPIYKLFGGKTQERKYFSILGHFIDPIKFIVHPIQSAQHKGSVVFNLFFDAMKGTDYAQRPYTTYKELFGIDYEKGVYKTTKKGVYYKGDPKYGKLKGKTVAYKFGGGGTLGYSQIPSFMINKLKGIQPVQIQNLISFIGGELDGFDALLNSLGLGIKSTYGLTEKNKEE